MNRRAGLVAFVAGVVVSLAAVAESRADQKQVLDRMVALNKSGIDAFTAGNLEKAKTDLLEAVVLGKQNDLALHAVMARTYLHLGVISIDGLKEADKAQRYFVMALKIRPDIELTPALASKTASQAFSEARTINGGAKVEPPAEEEEAEAEETKPEPKLSAKERRAAELAAAKEKKAADQAAAKERKAEEAAAREQEKRAQAAEAEKDKLLKELTKDLQQLRDTEKKEHAELEKLQRENKEKDKQLADLKAQAEKEKQEKDKQLADLRAQLGKEKQEKDKLANDSKERERKEREAKDKVLQEKLAVEAREKERKAKEDQARAEREKLAAGPDLPPHIPEPVFCPTQDQSPTGTELFVHCVAQPKVNAKGAILYYRTAGFSQYNALIMERSKKGWWTAAIPAAKVTGKTLQYYVEMRGGRDEVAASNGKAKMPNIMSLKPAVQKTGP